MLTCSVIIPSYERPDKLKRCLASLAEQTRAPKEVVVCWQADDVRTRDVALSLMSVPFALKVVHSAVRGIVPAENAALAVADADVIAMIDDDAVAPVDWIHRHLSHYGDPTVGAVGGPYKNYLANGTAFPVRYVQPQGTISWYGKIYGNLYDHPESWKAKPAAEVLHLAGGNMSFRRAALESFEEQLRVYWAGFELDACLRIRRRGYRILFDYANVIEHYPGETGHVEFSTNVAFNTAYIHGRHTPAQLRWARWLYLLFIGTLDAPGLLMWPLSMMRLGRVYRKPMTMRVCVCAYWCGWQAGAAQRRKEARKA